MVTETLLNRNGTFIDREGVIQNADGTVRDNDVPVLNAENFWSNLNQNSIAEAFIFDASFVKLREVAIRYNLPQSLIGGTFIKNLSVGFEARKCGLVVFEGTTR